MELVLKDLTKEYGSKVALDHVNLTFRAGVYGILGPNGAGKSTMMNLLTDNLKRTAGTITYDGTDILELGQAFRGKVGYMPQQQGMYEEFTARHFLQYMAGLKGLAPREARRQSDELLGVVNLHENKDQRIRSFSGGMKQRVMLAQALLGDPEVLILDEPTAGLDPEERIRIRNYISQIAGNKIVMIATHVVSDIEGIAGEVLLLSEGKVLIKGSVPELVASIRGKVSEGMIEESKLPELQQQYRISNVFHAREGKLRVRIIGDCPPEGFAPEDSHTGLEEVYLYYLNQSL